MPRVVIIGGAGYIGASCASVLAAAGCSITVVDTFASGRRDALKSTAAGVVAGDPREEAVRTAVAGTRPTAILYVGGVTDTRISNRAWMLRETVEPFRAVTAWATEWNVRLVYASSAAVYGNGPVPMREVQPASPHNAYGLAKLEMDRLAAEVISAGASVLGLRYFNVYGPGEQHKGATSSMVRQLVAQLRERRHVRLFEHGEQRRDFIHIDDVVRASVLALPADVTGVLNVGSGSEHSFNELAATIARALDIDEYRYKYLPVPASYQARTWADISRASATIGFTPHVPFVEGVSSYARTVSESISVSR